MKSFYNEEKKMVSEKTIFDTYRGIKVKVIAGSQEKPYIYRGEIINETDEFIFLKEPFSKTPISINKKDILKIQGEQQ